MRTKIIAALLAVLTALGGLNLFKSIKDRLTQPTPAQTSEVVVYSDATEEGTSKIRVRVKAKSSVRTASKVRVRATSASEVMIEERFSVRTGQTLAIDVTHADVEIETGNVTEAHIRVTLDSNNMERARERFELMNFQVFQVGDEVRIESESPKITGAGIGRGNLRSTFWSRFRKSSTQRSEQHMVMSSWMTSAASFS